ncbi:MAG: hypothetical protein KGI60_04940 [Patescibacteria group bacterium]|nr:hypothetical protein [Patescibacteria group bacterium]
MKSRFVRWAIVVLLAVSAVSVFYIWRIQSSQGLDLSVDVPSGVESGVPFDLKVNFTNNSSAVLNDARIAVTLPDGVAFFGSPADKTIDTQDLGNVGQGSLVQESFSLVVIAPEQTTKTMRIALSYTPSTLGARFEKDTQADVTVQSSGIALTITPPQQVTSGEEFETTVAFQNTSGVDFSNLKLTMEYPPSFSFSSASLKPDQDTNVWNLGDLLKGSEGKITIKGNLTGSENDIYTFNAGISEGVQGQTYPVSTGSATTSITASPLALTIHVNNSNDPNMVVHAGDTLQYVLSYINGTNVPLHNVMIQAQLAGEMFDNATIDPQGAYRQGDSVLIWDTGSTPSLALLPPGNAGALPFTVQVKKDFPISRFSDKNYMLTVNAQISSPTPSQSSTPFLTKAQLQTKVVGQLHLASQAYFRDANSGFLNEGSLPPKANQPTQFTIHWSLSSAAADVSGLQVQGTLADGVKMIGTPQSNSGSLPQYDPSTNQVTWQVNQVQANQGIIGTPIEAVFQVEATPTGAMAGTYMPLIGATTVSGTDVFTGNALTDTAPAVTTQLTDDSTVHPGDGVVQP